MPARGLSRASIASSWPALSACGLLLLAGLVMVALNPPSWRGTALPTELYNVDNKPKSDGLARLPATYEGVGGTRKDVSKGPDAQKLHVPDLDSERADAERGRLAKQAREVRPVLSLGAETSGSRAASRPTATARCRASAFAARCQCARRGRSGPNTARWHVGRNRSDRPDAQTRLPPNRSREGDLQSARAAAPGVSLSAAGGHASSRQAW